MVKSVSKIASLVAFAWMCSCGAPELTYRDDSPSSDGGLDAPHDSIGDSSQEADASPDVTQDGPADAVADVSEDVTQDVTQDAPEDAPQDAPQDAPADTQTDAPVDALDDAPFDGPDAAQGCPDDMITVARGDGTNFCIDAAEVTQQAFAAWLSTSPDPASQPAICALNVGFEPDLSGCVGGSYTPGTTPDLPVTCIDWCDAYAYCASLGRRLCGAPAGGATKYNKHQDAAESQWMRSCSAAGTMQYPYGNVYQSTTCNGADFGANGVVDAASTDCIGGVSGLYDMSGNVSEWEDCCAGAAPSALCRVRGGSYVDGAAALRCDATSDLHRDERSPRVGFRCCGN